MNALILMAHGSRHEPANEEVRGLARCLAAKGFADRVTAAFLEAQPDLPAAIGAQVAAGARSVIVLPLFLNTGNHVRRDIPRLIAAARAAHPGIRIDQLDHIGATDHYADFIARIAEVALGVAPRSGPAAPFDPAAQTAATILRSRLGPNPAGAIVLGSGLAGVTEALADPRSLDQSRLDSRLRPSVPGHPGRVVSGQLAGQTIWAWAGRLHHYEGYSFDLLTLPVRALAAAGVPWILFTNASGSLRPDLKAGDWVLITDHIDLPGLAGQNPLVGLDDPPGGSRFINQRPAYSPDLADRLRRAAATRNLKLAEGVYCYVSGPAYETTAEATMLARWGADVVGMSTVPEVLMARRLGVPVAGLSCVAGGTGSSEEASHLEVLDAVGRSVPTLVSLLEEFLATPSKPSA